MSSTTRLTAPLSPAAAKELAKLDRALLPQNIARAAIRAEVAAARYDELVAWPASHLSPAEFTALRTAREAVAEMFGILAAADRLDLIAPLEAAARYRAAAVHYQALAEAGDYEGCEYVRDEMTMRRGQLAAAGPLDLVGVAP